MDTHEVVVVLRVKASCPQEAVAMVNEMIEEIGINTDLVSDYTIVSNEPGNDVRQTQWHPY